MNDAAEKLREIAKLAGHDFAETMEGVIERGKTGILQDLATEALDLQAQAVVAETAEDHQKAMEELGWVMDRIKTKLLEEAVVASDQVADTIMTALKGALSVLKVVATETLSALVAGFTKGIKDGLVGGGGFASPS